MCGVLWGFVCLRVFFCHLYEHLNHMKLSLIFLNTNIETKVSKIMGLKSKTFKSDFFKYSGDKLKFDRYTFWYFCLAQIGSFREYSTLWYFSLLLKCFKPFKLGCIHFILSQYKPKLHFSIVKCCLRNVMVLIWYPVLFEEKAYCPRTWCWYTLHMSCKMANMETGPVALVDVEGLLNKISMGIL